MKFTLKFVAAGVMMAAAAGALAQKGETVKIAMIEGLSGPFANVGQNQLKSWQLMAQELSGAKNPAGVKFEIVGMDSKSSPQEALNLLKAASDQGFRYVTQGNGSNVAVPLADAVAKHNERNPGKEIVYLNYAAVDPVLTNEKCSFAHFRLDADTSMKMAALTAFMKDQPKISKIYLINQNYSHGQQVSKFFKEGLTRNRPDAKIVGDDLHPLGQVKDFAPYVAKIKQSGADTIVTGNWGQDMTLLIKALNDSGLKIPIYAYYAGVSGTPTALAAGGELEVYQIAYNHSNYTGEMGRLMADFKKKFNDDFYTFSIYNGVVVLGEAMAKAKSTDPMKVAAAMEGLKFKGFNGDSEIRKSDHQLQQGLWISKWQKVDAKNKYSVENTGYTFAPVKYLEPYIASTPTSCDMKRPF
ncbi:branched-chain amino acid ABC transporter substrate-binding protein [Variovorax sp. J22G21]|uniref:branched-chain amino acid ABC transporter substrate-binding protein n=1 Tax=Variovorax fucosicus TaxID=3053517 RepID=UPI002575A1D5|nr:MULTISPECIES: branched-chain amino acid ABC transporter substrate-binding protein [unclassified Variovorax]MDM0041106.1 branched-chain amino acid ABC transporter substrate-binding protein [Variovorax sp. J22R193]MDM0060163.1 branched-chain amino acid ABC transporter substrate-binding protein [Variovorax sp. J22G21]